jgi:GT2 family glycosyltransferase
MKILIGIVTYNRLDTLLKSIEAHIADGISESNILIVDNASSDQTVEVVKQQYPFIQFILNKDNLGSAGGFSICMQYAVDHGYDYVWLYNDDSRPKNGSYNNMIDAVGKLLKADARFRILKMGLARNGLVDLTYWKYNRYRRKVHISNEPVKTDLVSFDGCLIDINLIKKIGTCKPEYFMGIYEIEFCLRARDFGYNIYTLPLGLIDDEKKGSAGGAPYWRMYYVTRNHLRLALQRKSLRILIDFIYLELKKTISITLFHKDKYMKLKYKLKAIIDSLRGKMGRRVNPVEKLQS